MLPQSQCVKGLALRHAGLAGCADLCRTPRGCPAAAGARLQAAAQQALKHTRGIITSRLRLCGQPPT